MNKISATIVIMTAIFLSVVAGYFSIVGMMAIFSASAISVAIMMVGLEVGKVVASCCLKYCDWLARSIKIYLSLAVMVLLSITALGVYGHLAKGHLEQAAPSAPVKLQIAQKEMRIGMLREELTRLTTQQNQINTSIDTMIGKSNTARDARMAQQARNSGSTERAQVQQRLDTINTEMNAISQELVPLKTQIAEVETKLGPLQYVADLFGWKDPEAAVRLIILLMMFAFDPLAIVLMIVGTSMWTRIPKQKQDTDDQSSEPEEPELTIDDMSPADPDFSGVFVEASENADIDPPVVSSPKPTSWAFTYDAAPILNFKSMEHNEAPSLPANILPELEKILQKRSKSDAEALVELVEEHPEMIEEVAEVLNDNPDLLDEVAKITENKPKGWLDE